MLMAAAQTNAGVGGTSIKLVRVNLQGDTLWTRNLPIVTEAVTVLQIDQLVEYLAAPSMWKGVASVGDRKMIADSLRREAWWPPIRDSRIGRDNSIWITIGGPPWEPVRYWKLSPTGELQSVVQLPSKFRFLWADRKYVWGTFTNDDFELTIERYRLPE